MHALSMRPREVLKRIRISSYRRFQHKLHERRRSGQLMGALVSGLFSKNGGFWPFGLKRTSLRGGFGVQLDRLYLDPRCQNLLNP